MDDLHKWKWNVLIVVVGVLFVLNSNILSAQIAFSGTVIDNITHLPLDSVRVNMIDYGIETITDENGEFTIILPKKSENDSSALSLFSIHENIIEWSSSNPVFWSINDITGRLIHASPNFSANELIDFSQLKTGCYILTIKVGDETKRLKFLKDQHQVHFNINSFSYSGSPKIRLTKDGYAPEEFILRKSNDAFYKMETILTSKLNFTHKIPGTATFQFLESAPLNQTFGEVSAVKFIYEIASERIFYIQSGKFQFHFDFASSVLGYQKPLPYFNEEQYKNNPNRLYFMGAINHYHASGIYTLEFFASDEISCDEIEVVYSKIKESTFFGEEIGLFPNSPIKSLCQNVPLIDAETIYKGQNYQALNTGTAYGFLKKVELRDVESTYLGCHDIVLTNGIPLDIPVVAGMITTVFQPPLCHINVLSRNRGTPNMALRDGWRNNKLLRFEGKLVRLEVEGGSFTIVEASLFEAEQFWQQKENKPLQVLVKNDYTRGLINLYTADRYNVSLIGGKAANFAEIMKAKTNDGKPIPVPEGAFAIPFYYYSQHVERFGIDHFRDSLMDLAEFKSNSKKRMEYLELLRDSIKAAPLNQEFLQMVIAEIESRSQFQRMRFRSSTNAEDLAHFNGAGLYDSYTGIPSDPKKTVERAIKRVWASLWNFRAFEEREYFRIDQKSIAMGILVHRSFPDEDANGVLITRNLYNENIPAYTINVQHGEISVVNPENNYLPDQIIFYNYDMNIPAESQLEYINYSNVPGFEGKPVMEPEELRELVRYCMDIRYYFCKNSQMCLPLDIEFKVDSSTGEERKIYIKQARAFVH